MYQDQTQREITPGSSLDQIAYATSLRKEWADRHARSHTSHQHKQLRLSGRAVTPEAAIRLVPFGISPLSDMVSNETNPYGDEYSDAALAAPRQPQNDVEDSLKPIHVGFSGDKTRYPY